MITVTLMKKQKNSEKKKKQQGWEYLKTWVGIF